MNNTNPHGQFPKGSLRLLTTEDLRGKSQDDLKIMRNEIYAQHGYFFTTSDMTDFFQKQPWNCGRLKDISAMLTSIERLNVSLIKSFE